MDVSIITSLYNRLDLTRAWLESLERTLTGWRFEVILIDDGSVDGTRDFLAGLPPDRYRVRLNDRQRGFAVNNNVGARLARAPLLCLLNNDTLLLPGWLEPMARLARWDARSGLVGNVQREPVSGLIDHFGVYFDPQDGRPLHAGKNRASYTPADLYTAWPAVTAACCVVRRSTFEELGGFDESYRNGFEDVDLCLRAGARGYRHFVANRSVIYHHISASPNRRAHEDANLSLFRSRWAGKVPLGLPEGTELHELHAEGRRYLRKHRYRPWRYNFWRLRRALDQRFRRAPSSRRLRLPLRWILLLPDRADRARQPAPADAVVPHVFLVVTDTVRNPSRSGIQTVVRSLAAALGTMEIGARAVIWDPDSKSLQLLPPTLSAGLAAEPLRDPARAGEPMDQRTIPAGAWVVMPELVYEGGEELIDYVHRHGWRIALIFHDAIAVRHPELVPPSLPARHERYMRDFSRADLILPVSQSSAEAWDEFVRSRKLARPEVRTCILASDLAGTPRVVAADLPAMRGASGECAVRLLCVSTIEPRKNHRALLAAFRLAAAARPGRRLELDLVGAPYTGCEDLAREVAEFVARQAGAVTWYEQIEYSLLRRLYEAADFTVYPSVLEGFGLPVIESMWFGRPCVCANFGVMAENAADGGCLTTDVRDPQALADAMLTLIDSPERCRELALAATGRRLKTWEEYTTEVVQTLERLPGCSP